MIRKKGTKILSLLLAVMMVFTVIPVNHINAYADLGVSDYNTFLQQLKVLEAYADEYSTKSGRDANELVVNFIRTGVSRYNDGNWKTLAGEEITGFTDFVKQQDVEKGTTVMALRNIIIDNFKLPNGNAVDFGHMFGTLNIAYVASQQSADLGGWAGDICDLMLYSREYGKIPEGSIEEKAAFIRQNCFGVDADDAFGMDDFYGDMDAFYINQEVKKGKSFSEVMEAYFTESLTDNDRAAYFLNNRFKGVQTKDQVRSVIYSQYSTNVGLSVLEASRDLTDEHDLRYAACYAFADYLYELAGDRLSGGETEEPDEDRTYNIFSTTNSTLAPGITQSINYALNSKENQFIYYMSTIDIRRSDVNVYANYKNADASKWGMQRLSVQMQEAEKLHSNPSDKANYIENYKAIAGINADFYNMNNGQPSGQLVMNGVVYQGGSGNFFGILKDGSPIIGGAEEWKVYKDQIQEAVAGSVLIVKNGEYVKTSGNYYNEPGSRSVVGITADGQVMFLVVDGRQKPMSIGATAEEAAQIMIDAGCITALHLDGGGSATYAAKQAGSDKIEVVSSPSDGYERSVSSTLVAVSTAKSSNEFGYANITADYDYLTAGTDLQLSAIGISETGNPAQIPENAIWKVSDETIGEISDKGVFTALATGTVEVQLAVGDIIIGKKTLNVVVPDNLEFTKQNFNVVYDTPFTVPIKATYNNNNVKFNAEELMIFWEVEEAATIDGLEMTVFESSGVRKMIIVGMHTEAEELFCETTISMFSDDEAYFDFDNVTAGNRMLAWTRKVNNAVQESEKSYHIIDTNEDMTAEYTFGLDMSTIEVPEQLSSLTYMLPGASEGATAWDFLLSLAERISVLTEVSISVKFDENVDVDISNLSLSTEFFTLKDSKLDKETNTLNIKFGWIDRSSAIYDSTTVNPICILSGLKITPKDSAAWNKDNILDVSATGEVSYKIYLRASSLYAFALQEANQKQYGLYPFTNPEVIVEGKIESGAYFGTTYADFEDDFSLDKTNRNGWVTVGDKKYYYVDNAYVTGVQKLPSIEDAKVNAIYEFDDNGCYTGKATGLVTIDGNSYYAIDGKIMTGWRQIDGADYYFRTSDGAAVDGVQKIDGYTYTFENKILKKGQIITTKDGKYQYMWAGRILFGKWFELDGNKYCSLLPQAYLATGLAQAPDPVTLEKKLFLFNDKGVFLSEYTGLYKDGGKTYYIEKGEALTGIGLVLVDGYYYYISSGTGTAVKNGTYWISNTHGLLPPGPFQFDEEGRIVNPPSVDPTPDEPDKNGIVNVAGTLYYYKNNAIQYAAGMLKLEDGHYIYVRSNGQLGIGNIWVTTTNGLVTEGMHYFDENGYLKEDTAVNPEPTPDPNPNPTPDTEKNGVVKVGDVLYYYQNGAIAYCAGLIQLHDGSYVYVRSNGQLGVGRIWVTNTNGVVTQGWYQFDENGIMQNPPGSIVNPTPKKNGIVEENGILHYYINDVLQYGLGLIEVEEGKWIYVSSNSKVYTGRVWVTNTNNVVKEGWYEFDQNGYMINIPS